MLDSAALNNADIGLCRCSGVKKWASGPHAIGEKASDYTYLPLCLEHHRIGTFALDKIGREMFERPSAWKLLHCCRGSTLPGFTSAGLRSKLKTGSW